MSFGCVGSAQEMWRQGIADVGSVYRLPSVRKVHSGFDGASWCSGGLERLRDIGCDAAEHLDPFHVDRAVFACFDRDHEEERLEAMELIYDGDADGCADLPESMAEDGSARADIVAGVVGYLRGHADPIGISGPSLGTMEAGNQHVYRSRMTAVPCAWSEQGTSDMARICSRQASGHERLRISRGRSGGAPRGARGASRGRSPHIQAAPRRRVR